MKRLFFLLVLAAAAWVFYCVQIPVGPSTETFLEIAPGTASMQIAAELKRQGLVRSQYVFEAMRLIRGGTLKAGEYRFDHPAKMEEVFGRLRRGDVYTVSLTIPEGSNLFGIAQRVEAAHLGGRDQFLAAAKANVSLIADLDPGAKSLEGYLFPDTYRFPPTVTARQIVTAMVKRFRVVAVQLGLRENVHQVVTIASLVERETAVDAERPLVASVFLNRLAKHMPLQTDPSVIYGLELAGKWRGTIYASDLTRDTPYNTYVHAGLPPGPVANPGLPSLRAAMDPAKTNYLYFVAAGTDAQGHALFAETLEEHNRNVAEYRNAQKKRAGGR